MTTTFRRFLLVFCILLIGSSAFADYLVSESYGYTIDFPEGFDVLDGEEDGSSALLQHTILPVQAVLRVWDAGAYKDARAALEATCSRLGAAGEVTAVRWRNQDCALTQFTMQNAAVTGTQSGWGAAYTLSQKRGFLTLLCYAEQSRAYDAEQFMLSVLDSVMIDRGSFRECGIVTAFAYPSKEKKTVTLSIAGKEIRTTLGAEDVAASQFVIDREFAVFKLYVQTKLWKEAWQRFYRQIARDTFGRTKKCAFDIASALQADAKRLDPDTPDAAMAQLLLTWVQGFSYARESSRADKADFAPIPAVLSGAASDCDSRSLLVAVLLQQMNVDACLFISNVYSHAMLGVLLPGKLGQTISADGKEYLVGETTAKNLTLGMMDASMQDRSKWIPVTFP